MALVMVAMMMMGMVMESSVHHPSKARMVHWIRRRGVKHFSVAGVDDYLVDGSVVHVCHRDSVYQIVMHYAEAAFGCRAVALAFRRL